MNVPSTISIDGRVRNRNATEFRTDLEPGTYLVTVENSGSREGSLKESVTIEGDQTVTKRFEFTKAATGTLQVTSEPSGAKILVNGEMQNGLKTPQVLTLSEGKYVISAISGQSGNSTLQESVDVRAGRQSEVSFDFAGEEVRMLAARLADSVRTVKGSLDETSRGTKDFSAAIAAEQAGKDRVGDKKYDDAVKEYRSALEALGRAKAARDVATREVKATLEKFGQAYQAKDIGALKALYPSIPGNEESGWKQFFESARDLTVKMSIDQMTVESASAEVTVTVQMVFSDRQGKKDQSFRWLIQFEETGSNWVVAKRETL